MAHCTDSQESLGGTTSLPSPTGELTQSEIQSVLDSIFFSPSSSSLPPSLSLPSSLPSTLSQSSSSVTSTQADQQQQCLADEDTGGTSSSTQPKYTTSTSSGRRIGTQVSLSHLLHSHLYITQSSLSLGPTGTQSFAGCTGIVTSVDDSRGVVSLSLTPPTTSVHTLLLYRPSVQLLEPVRPKEGEMVRIIRGVSSGLEGRLDVCKDTFQYMIHSLCGRYRQLVGINDTVRLVRPVSTTATPTSPHPALSPSPPPSRPLSLGTNELYLTPNQLLYEATPLSYEAMSPSLSPSSPWTPYSPQESTDAIHNSVLPSPLTPPPPNLFSSHNQLTPSSIQSHTPSLRNHTHQPLPYSQYGLCSGLIPPGHTPSMTQCRVSMGGVNQSLRLPSYMRFNRLQAPPTYSQSVAGRVNGSVVSQNGYRDKSISAPSSAYQSRCGPGHTPRDPCFIFKKIFNCSSSSPSPSNESNIIEQLKNMACSSNGKFKSPLSCPGRVIQPDLLIDKVINNLMCIEPPDDWYRGSNKEERMSVSDEVCTESVVVSSNCPLTKQKMTYPSRGLHCCHLQCFDAKAFLQMALRKYRKSVTSKGQGSSGVCAGVCLKCPVCNKVIGLKELIIDKYLKKVLEVTDAVELQCHGNGDWKPVEKIDQTPLSVIDLTLDDDDD